jgi:hypothetical protein
VVNKKSAIDFGERVTATFFQAFIALALVTGLSDVTAVKAAAVAGALAAGKFAYVKINKYLAESDSSAVG